MWAQDENLAIDITKAPDEQVIPGDEIIDVASEDTPPSVDDTKVDVEDTTPPAKQKHSNKSNFKKMSQSLKTKDARIAELEAEAAGKKAPETEIEDDDEWELSYDKVDLLEFITDNEWANLYKEQMKDLLDEFPGMTFEKALTFAKAQEPEESKSHTMFNAKSSTAPKTKKLSSLTPEEAAEADLTPAQMDAWSKSQKEDVNPFG